VRVIVRSIHFVCSAATSPYLTPLYFFQYLDFALLPCLVSDANLARSARHTLLLEVKLKKAKSVAVSTLKYSSERLAI